MARERHPRSPAYNALAVRLMLDEMRQNLMLIAQAVQEIRHELRYVREQRERVEADDYGHMVD